MAEAAVQVAIFKMGLDSSAYQAGAKTVDQSNEQMIDSFTRVEAKYDPLIRAEQRRSAALAQASRFLEEGSITQERYIAQVGRVNAAYETQVAAANRAGMAISNNNRIMMAGGGTHRSFGHIAQQAGFQVADFAIQVQAGQGAMRAFVQQGSQLLGFFGPWGAIIGAAVAVIGALATGLMGLGDASDTAGKAINTYGEALEESNKLLKTSTELTQELTSARMEDARFAIRDAILVEQATISTLESIAAKRREYFKEIQESIPSTVPQSGVPSSLTGPNATAIGAAQRRIGVLEGLLSDLDNPANLGANREGAGRSGRGGKSPEDARRDREEQFGKWLLNLREKLQDDITRDEEKNAKIRLDLIDERIREEERARQEMSRNIEEQTNMLLDQVLALRGLIDGTFDWRDATVNAVEMILRELAKLQTFGGQGGGMFGAGGFLQLLLGIGGAAAGGMFPGGVGAPAAGAPILSGMFAAEGGEGVVTKPTLFLAGERGAEKFKFTPVPKATNDGSGSVMYQINIAGDADEGKIERVLTRHIPNIIKASENKVMRRAGQSVGGANAWMRSP